MKTFLSLASFLIGFWFAVLGFVFGSVWLGLKVGWLWAPKLWEERDKA